jgi:hypothetical protein
MRFREPWPKSTGCEPSLARSIQRCEATPRTHRCPVLRTGDGSRSEQNRLATLTTCTFQPSTCNRNTELLHCEARLQWR